jgi:multimeric flavodoxin WrbA
MMKLLTLKGSPRLHGNSSTLADQLSAGATQAGAQVESVFLHRLKIHPCNGCDACVKIGRCPTKDDMQPLYDKLIEADAIVLASPIYWFNYTAQLKICIDRWYAIWKNNHDAFKNKPFGFILTYGDTDLYNSGAINAIYTFETMVRFLDARIIGWVYGSLSDVGDAQKNPELMQKAFQLGEKIVSVGSDNPPEK